MSNLEVVEIARKSVQRDTNNDLQVRVSRIKCRTNGTKVWINELAVRGNNLQYSNNVTLSDTFLSFLFLLGKAFARKSRETREENSVFVRQRCCHRSAKKYLLRSR